MKILISGVCGFASFLCYLSYGYLDNWHGIATLCLLPAYLTGLWRARPETIDWRDAWRPGQPMSTRTRCLRSMGLASASSLRT